ncbi:DNA repair/transcription protein [Trichophyton violaceum]|uniref:MMS19 nucleotide excision repair protein n=1 Tax=Trichophyton violaceum TaxID=34388 RepID=A0A178FPY0_TRIVO|nr:DNA repair/transcription protein [Trichophyton violaceum]
MAELQDFMLVAEKDRDEAMRIASVVASKLESKQTTLIDIVKSLGEYINDEDASIRGKAVSYLTAVIIALPDKFLSRQQIQVLTTFFCARIEDGGSITGLRTLHGMERFDKSMAQDAFRAIYQHSTEFRSRPQSQRLQVLHLLNELMAKSREAMREMNDESLIGIVDLVSGERDPRNLMIVFSILKVVMMEWDISGHTQDLFDAAYNYFPITFRPPPNDPYGVTAQDLKDRLQACITSTSLFAPYSFPALLDKLDSTSANVKRDALKALNGCIESYSPATIARYSISIWDCLKFEILNAQDEVLPAEALRVLHSLASNLPTSSVNEFNKSPLAQLLKPVTNECIDQLREPLQKQAKPARQILSSLSSASSPAFTLITEYVTRPLISIYQNADSISKQREILETFVELFKSAVTVFGTWTTITSESSLPNPLVSHKDVLTQIFSKSLMGSAEDENSFRLSALKGLIELSILPNFLEDNEIGLFVQYFDDILLQERIVAHGELRKETINALAKISKNKPQLIIDITFPALLATLPDMENGDDESYLYSLDSLARISIEKEVFNILVRRLLSKLDVVTSSNGSSTYTAAILTTILYAMEHREDLENDPNLNFYYEKIVQSLCGRTAKASTTGGTALNHPRVLDTLGRLCNLIIRHLPRATQDEVCKNIYALFTTGEGFTPALSSEQPTTLQQKQMIIISTYILAALPKDISPLPYTNTGIEPLLQQSVKASVSEESDPSIQLALGRHVALLANKFLSKEEIQCASDVLFSLIPSSSPTPLSQQTIRTIFWLSKALILRLAPSTTQILTSLLDLLDYPDTKTSALCARGFSILLAEDSILNVKNGAIVRLLAKQKVFTTVTPLISARVHDANTSATTHDESSLRKPHSKESYLTALSGLLSTIPSSLVMTKLPTLLPLLLQSLDLHSAAHTSSPESSPTTSGNIKSVTLKTLAIVIHENGVQVINEIGYVEDLVTRLLRTAKVHSKTGADVNVQTPDSSTSKEAGVTNAGNPAKVRAQALQCLTLLANNPVRQGAEGENKKTLSTVSPLLRLKKTVLRDLLCVLDDPKRDVRKAAVDARAAWLRNVEDETNDGDD